MGADVRKTLFLLLETAVYLAGTARLMGLGVSEWIVGPLFFVILGLYTRGIEALGRGA